MHTTQGHQFAQTLTTDGRSVCYTIEPGRRHVVLLWIRQAENVQSVIVTEPGTHIPRMATARDIVRAHKKGRRLVRRYVAKLDRAARRKAK